MPKIFSDYMVLQQNSTVMLWGKATPKETVSVSTNWSKKSYSCKVKEDGNWSIGINTPIAGTSYEIKVIGSNLLHFKNVAIGEVWFCSGQSNMDFPVKGYTSQPVNGSLDAILGSENKNIRFFDVKKEVSTSQKDDCQGNWLAASPETTPQFSATAYFFAKALNQKLNVPIGIITSSWGGSRAECFMSKEGLAEFPKVEIPSGPSVIKEPTRTATGIFNAMIAPLVKYKIKGVLWYQGENHRNDPEHYKKLFPALVKDWRAQWGYEFPFYFAQIAPFGYFANHGLKGYNSAYIRQVQAESEDAIPNSGMVVLMDVGEKNCIHPAEKQVVGKRFAFLALSQQYNLKGNINYRSPQYTGMNIKDSVITLNFKYASNGLTTFGKYLDGFEIAGEDKVFHPAKAEILYYKDKITLKSPKVIAPVAVRYAYQDFIVGTLFNTEGFPLSSFRTDDWEIPFFK
jgi:sialate O-acetylesterase